MLCRSGTWFCLTALTSKIIAYKNEMQISSLLSCISFQLSFLHANKPIVANRLVKNYTLRCIAELKLIYRVPGRSKVGDELWFLGEFSSRDLELRQENRFCQFDARR